MHSPENCLEQQAQSWGRAIAPPHPASPCRERPRSAAPLGSRGPAPLPAPAPPAASGARRRGGLGHAHTCPGPVPDAELGGQRRHEWGREWIAASGDVDRVKGSWQCLSPPAPFPPAGAHPRHDGLSAAIKTTPARASAAGGPGGRAAKPGRSRADTSAPRPPRSSPRPARPRHLPRRDGARRGQPAAAGPGSSRPAPCRPAPFPSPRRRSQLGGSGPA